MNLSPQELDKMLSSMTTKHNVFILTEKEFERLKKRKSLTIKKYRELLKIYALYISDSFITFPNEITIVFNGHGIVTYSLKSCRNFRKQFT